MEPALAIGVDVASVSRVGAALERWPALAQRIFTDKEWRYCQATPQRCATRFAAKEAVRKLAGSLGHSPLPGWRQIEVVMGATGAPHAVVAGFSGHVSLSLSHEGDTAIAVAVASQSGDASVSCDADIELPERDPSGFKNSFGTVVVVGGSSTLVGAPYLCAMGAARAGAGLVRVCVPRCAHAAIASRCLEVMPYPLPSDELGLVPEAVAALRAHVEAASAVAIGPGLGRTAATQRVVAELLPAIEVPTVVDADALVAVAETSFDWRRCRQDVVITPHPGEMARLTATSSQAVQDDRRTVASDYARRSGVTVVLKGAATVVAAPDGRVWTDSHTAVALATGGTGDVLGGVIAALLGQRMEAFQAARAAVTVHVQAGLLVEAQRGRAGALAGDVVEALPEAQEMIRRHLERLQ